MGLPAATYRLQLNRSLRWADAARIVDYLDRLGIDACYVSPILAARPGSEHGYDVVDFGRLNPELGTEEEFRAFAQTLRRRGMGLVVDVVPNHMFIGSPDNLAWRDLLENGPSSPFARHFDVDWTPPKPDLEAKVLLPVLADQYGLALEAGEIDVVRADGRFDVTYRTLSFPVDPKSWPQILRSALRRLRGGEDAPQPRLAELESIVTALDHLPPRTETDAARIQERLREKEVARRRLATLLDADGAVRRAVDEELAELNGRTGDPRSFDRLETLLAAQGYRLSHWRVAADEINYRRFFDVNELAALRMEEPAVFDAAHEVLRSLARDGLVTGVRIDHVDGLWDPESYCSRLRDLLGAGAAPDERYVVVEKILGARERLPERWPVHGTTGYDFLNLVSGLLVRPEGMQALIRFEARLAGERRRFADVSYESKKLVLHALMSSELTVLARRLDRISEQHRASRDFTLQGLHDALREVIACFPVYRTYVRPGDAAVSEQDRGHVEAAVRAARQRNPTTSASLFEFARSVLLLEAPDGLDPAQIAERREFVLRFQQLTAPVMAKGLEDTAFYRYFPLAALNEVGGPADARGVSIEEFHRRLAERQRLAPHAMSATSTHDTKRGEDVRARLLVLSEVAEAWELAVERWREANRPHRDAAGGEPAPDDLEEYLIYQTLVGAWPDGGRPVDPEFVARLQAAVNKALREAKLHTSWTSPDVEYEQAVERFVARLLDRARSPAFLDDARRFHMGVAPAGAWNSLTQVLLKVAAPGVADFYRGTELWDLSLVDPDNRRPVDFASRAARLDEIAREAGRDAAGLAERLMRDPEDGRVKLFVTARALAFRRAHRALFERGSCLPIASTGPRTEHVIAFARVEGGEAALAVAGRWYVGLGAPELAPVGEPAWQETRLLIPRELAARRWREAITGALVETRDGAHGRTLRVADALARLPVALLEAT